MAQFAGVPILFISIALPLLLSPLAYLFGRRLTAKAAGLFSHVTLFFPLLFSVLTFPTISSGGEVVERFEWIPELGLSFSLRLDSLSYIFYLLISLVGFLASIYSWRYMEHEHRVEAYYALTMLFVAGMLGVVLSTNLFLLYIFWELMLVPSYFLIAYWGTGNPRIIGFKYFMMTHVGAIALLGGIAWLNALYGSVDYSVLSAALSTTSPEHVYIALLIFIGAAVKMALFPFHTWLPDAHAEAPTPISVLLSGVMIKTGVYALARLVISFMPQAFEVIATPIMILAIVTVFWGGVLALVQTDIKRVLAYSSVSQIGYIAFGLSLAIPIGLSGAMLHVLTHGFAKALLFMTAGSIIHSVNERDIRKLGGLARAMPLTSIAFLVGGLSIAGTPPLAGFFSEWMIFTGGFEAGLTLYAILVILATAITAGYYLRVFMYVFQVGPHRDVHEAPPSMLSSMLVLAVIIVGLVFLAAPLLLVINAGLPQVAAP